ncbi:MAG: Na+-dependent transporter [Xanthobacteraceae bacterium]
MPSTLRKSLTGPVRALTWIGRQGTRAVAALVFLGIAVPPLGALLAPYVTEAIFLLLTVAFMRVDMAAVVGHMRRPGLVLAATAWTTLVVPLLFGLCCVGTGLDRQAPDLFLGVMLQGIASPVMAGPAFAALMGLDATLVLITLVTSTALVPLTAPLFAYVFLGSVLTLSPLALGLKLFAILCGSLVVAALIRRIVGAPAIERHKVPIDGLNILLMLVFVDAVMGGVAGSFLAAPWRTAGILLLSFVIFFAVFALSVLVLRKIAGRDALALGLLVAQRNMGLMLAATAGALPSATWLYFALAQFPLYISPQLLRPIARRQAAQLPTQH